MIILILFSFLAGIVTILSPCILPMLPIILSSTIGDKKVGKSRSLGVIFGFIASFTFFTLFLTSIVKILNIPASTLRHISIFVIFLFGVSILIPKLQEKVEILFAKISNFYPQTKVEPGLFSGIIIGLSLGLLWTPCVGPILASVISLSLSGEIGFDTFLITLSYAIGTAIPMLMIMNGGQKILNNNPWLIKNSANIQKAFGVIMILTAFAIYFNLDRKFQGYILDTFPNYSSNLTKVEYGDFVKNQLIKLNK